MADFTPITTQEEFDKAIADRIGRAKDSVRKEYEGYISPDDLNKKIADITKEKTDLSEKLEEANKTITQNKTDMADKDAKIKAYETASVKTKIAQELGMSYEAIEFLKGDDEESIRKSAEALQGIVGKSKQAPPLGNPEGSGGDSDASQSAYKDMLKSMKGE